MAKEHICHLVEETRKVSHPAATSAVVSHPPSSPPHASRPVARSRPSRRAPCNVLLSSARLQI